MCTSSGDDAGEETWDVKLLIAIVTLAGSLSLLVSDWAGNGFPYL